MWSSPHVWAAIALRTAIIYVFILAGFRLMGKREIGQMTPFDLVLLLIANAVQNAMTGPDTSVAGGVAAAGVLFLINFCVDRWMLGHRLVRRWFMGSPTLLIHDGEILDDHLRREGIARETLEAALREHGVFSPADVSLAVLEMDGSISVLKKDDIVPGPRPHRHIRFLNRRV